MNELLLAFSGLMAICAVAFLVQWVVDEWRLPLVAMWEDKWTKQACAQPVPALPRPQAKVSAPGPLHKADEAVRMLFQGCPCSEVMLSVYGPALGISRGEAFEFCLRHAKQMNLHQTCCAVTGACIALGTRGAAKRRTTGKTVTGEDSRLQEFVARYKARQGSILCRNPGNGGGAVNQSEAIAEQPVWSPQICPKLIHDAAEILEEMLN